MAVALSPFTDLAQSLLPTFPFSSILNKFAFLLKRRNNKSERQRQEQQ